MRHFLPQQIAISAAHGDVAAARAASSESPSSAAISPKWPCAYAYAKAPGFELPRTGGSLPRLRHDFQIQPFDDSVQECHAHCFSEQPLMPSVGAGLAAISTFGAHSPSIMDMSRPPPAAFARSRSRSFARKWVHAAIKNDRNSAFPAINGFEVAVLQQFAQRPLDKILGRFRVVAFARISECVKRVPVRAARAAG